MPLWKFEKSSLLRAAQEIDPNIVEVTLTTGLWATVWYKDGRSDTIGAERLTRNLTCKDFNKKW